MSIKRTNGQVDPTKCLSAINPRSLTEYALDLMVTELVATEGIVEEPISVLRLSPDDPIWQEIGLDNTDESWRIANRDLLLRGHRRCAGSRKIVESPQTFTGLVVANAKKVPAIIYEGMTMQEAHDFTIDDKGKVPLKRRDIVKMVLARFHAGMSYQEIAVKFPQLLFGAFIKDGDVKFAELAKEDDGKKRLKGITDGLKNVLDSWFRSAYILGPAVEKQLVTWVGKKKDKDAIPKGERSLMDCQMSAMQKLRAIRFQSVKGGTKSEDPEKAKLCTPITKVDRDTDSNVITVEGGNSEVNEALKKALMEEYDPSTKEKKAKLPNEKDRKATLLALSETGKAFAAFMNGEDCENVMEADEKNHKMELRQQWRGGVLEMCRVDGIHIDGILKKFLDAETNCKVQVEYEESLLELITALQPVKPKGKKQKVAV